MNRPYQNRVTHQDTKPHPSDGRAPVAIVLIVFGAFGGALLCFVLMLPWLVK